MQRIAPEMVLGKEVRNDHGDRLGEVVDVGIHDLRRVKFLLIETPDGRTEEAPPNELHLVRLGVELIASIGNESVVVREPAKRRGAATRST